MLPVTKTALPPLAEYSAYLEEIWRNGWITNNGDLSKRLAAELARFLDLPNLELLSCGTLALQLAIRALDLRGEIITTPYSYVATTNAILWERCEPVFVDIEDKTFCIDPDLIEAAIGEKTVAILATHVYGYPCDVERIQAIAQKYRLKVIYDGAHAFGVKLGGRSLSIHGDCTALSFHATKLFHTAEGGALACNDPALAQRIALTRSFGHIGEDEYLEIGINAKMSELHAAMGLCMLPMVGQTIAERRQCAQHYDALLEAGTLRRPAPAREFEYNYAYYPVIFPSETAKMQARRKLLDQGIGPRRYFYPSLNTLPFLKPELRRPCPVSEDICSRVLCLPQYGGLQEIDIARICAIVRDAVD